MRNSEILANPLLPLSCDYIGSSQEQDSFPAFGSLTGLSKVKAEVRSQLHIFPVCILRPTEHPLSVSLNSFESANLAQGSVSSMALTVPTKLAFPNLEKQDSKASAILECD